MEQDPIEHMHRLLIRLGADPQAVRTASNETRKAFGGEQVYLRRIDRDARDQDIKQALQAGHKPEVAAKLAGCSPATVRRRRSRWL